VIEIRRTTLDDWLVWKEMRLTALRSAPTAYGETYATAVAGDDHYWQKWWLERADDTAMRSMAYVDGTPAGQVGCLQWRGPDSVPMLIAMWVEQRFRGSGVADALVADVVDWARDNGFQQLELGVTEGNETALKLYLRHGFESTGRTEYLHSFPDLQIEYMIRDLGPAC
jgi:GNAT superfamily N-acetyltransferase